MKAASVKRALAAAIDPAKAAFYPRFFKAGKGQYAEGDRFLGVVVPEQRKIARAFRGLPLSQVRLLLASSFHEHRFTGLLILAEQVPAARRRAGGQQARHRLAAGVPRSSRLAHAADDAALRDRAAAGGSSAALHAGVGDRGVSRRRCRRPTER